MKNAKLISFLTLCSLFMFGLVSTAGAAQAGAGRAAVSEPGFYGTRAEMTAFALPQLLQRAGHAVVPADQGLVAALQGAFGGSREFLWSQTFVTQESMLRFSVTLPADISSIERGVVALGVIENGVLARVFRAELSAEKNTFAVKLSHPDGRLATELRMGVGRDGKLRIDQRQLKQFASVVVTMDPGGLFDPLIEILEMILDLLYMLKDLLNLAICVCNETIELLNDLNGCGWGSTTPGGGAVINLIICSVDSTIQFIDELVNGCF